MLKTDHAVNSSADGVFSHKTVPSKLLNSYDSWNAHASFKLFQ